MSLIPALATVPIWMPRGNIEGRRPAPSEPFVMIVSPRPTCFAFETRSIASTDAAPFSRCTTPIAVGTFRSAAVTALSSSVSSMTRETCAKTREIVPTSPSGVITTSPAATRCVDPVTRSEVPAAIVMLASLALGGAVSTDALSRSKSLIVGGPW